MTKVNLKNNICIEGFDTADECFTPVAQFHPDKLDNVLYEGRTSEILEELAREYVHIGVLTGNCKNYQSGFNIFETARESIQSACDKEFCVIYKID